LNYFDLIIAIALVATAISGFRNGLLQSIFKTVGLIAGGVIGVALAVEVMSKWSHTLAKVGGTIILILLLATSGEFILGKVGLGFRKVLVIPPLKLCDSLLGAALGLLRTVFITHLICIISIATPWSIGDKFISTSKFYIYLDLCRSKLATHLKYHLMN
jgi:uncharacterized membrane protein required for colicin V production